MPARDRADVTPTGASERDRASGEQHMALALPRSTPRRRPRLVAAVLWVALAGRSLHAETGREE
ncbi:MAG: hypothetical protein ACRDHE_08065, partial [Ktedonobacterales bacterium]